MYGLTGTELDFSSAFVVITAAQRFIFHFRVCLLRICIFMSRPVVGAWYCNIHICSRGVAVSDDCFGLSIILVIMYVHARICQVKIYTLNTFYQSKLVK
jgi:hypothetical protein